MQALISLFEVFDIFSGLAEYLKQDEYVVDMEEISIKPTAALFGLRVEVDCFNSAPLLAVSSPHELFVVTR